MTDDSTVDDTFAQFLDFGAGVLALVLLSCSVIWGLVAQDRIVLDARRRILAQAVHRTTAVASVVFLLLHIGVKLALDHTTWVAAVLPFGLLATDEESFGGRSVLIGFGTLASMLMIFVGVTAPCATASPSRHRWPPAGGPCTCWPTRRGAWPCCTGSTRVARRNRCSPSCTACPCSRHGGPGAARGARPVKREVADRIAALLGTEERTAREELEESRSRATASALPGYGGPTASRPRGTSPSAPLYEPAERVAAREPAHGFAAAYRAVSGSRAGAGPADRRRDPAGNSLGPAAHRGDARGGRRRSTSGSWPIPSPPPVGEAPPSAYDPLDDTGHTIPVYGAPDPTGRFPGPGPSDVYDTGETNAVHDTYYPNDTTAAVPNRTGPRCAVARYALVGPRLRRTGFGEPWNTPSGGYE